MAKKTNNGRVAAEVGAGLAAAAAAAAAGYYFYGSDDAKKHRKVAAKWASNMQKEVLKEAKKLRNVDAKSIAKAIDSAARAYQGARSVSPEELLAAANELKANWRMIEREAKAEGKRAGGRARTVVKKVKKNVGKTAKKIIKKAMKKATKRGGKKARR